MQRNNHLWALVLAAGDGKRVRSLTHTSDGALAPKQFCTVHGRQSLLSYTIDRGAALVPMERIVTVVAEQHRGWWESELSGHPSENVVVQPHNRGTAVGILLPLLKIVRRDPLARIILLPTDHYVARESLLRESIEEANRAVQVDGSRVILLGMMPRESDTEYGWIVPSAENRAVCEVATFVEKPDSARARFLLRRGALLNSLILVATGRAFLQLFARATPQLIGDFISWRENATAGPAALETLYRKLSSHDFSREVLEPSCASLSVLRAPDCGWMDVGTPARLEFLHSYRTGIDSAGLGAASGAGA